MESPWHSLLLYPPPRLNAHALLDAWKNVPVVDAQRLRTDIDKILDFDL